MYIALMSATLIIGITLGVLGQNQGHKINKNLQIVIRNENQALKNHETIMGRLNMIISVLTGQKNKVQFNHSHPVSIPDGELPRP